MPLVIGKKCREGICMKFNFLNKKIEKPKEQEGVPDIADFSYNKKPAVFILLGLGVIFIFGVFNLFKPHKKQMTEVAETYTPQVENAIQQKMTLQPTVTAPIVETKPEVTPEQIAMIQEKQKELQQRLSAPLLVVNDNGSNKLLDTKVSDSTSSDDPNTQFMNQLSAQISVSETATTIGLLQFIVAEGAFIHVVLESATNSDLPGYLRAIVSEAVYSEDGTNILIPIGSILIGQYKSGMLQGQSRIFIVWMRLITPSGISINLGSPGVDSLGVAGMGADEVNRHFWERFGTASLLSMIGAGAANMGVSGNDQDNSASEYRAAVANSFSQSANQSLQREAAIATTLKSYQGKPINVFVAHDLNFQNAMKQVKPKINVF